MARSTAYMQMRVARKMNTLCSGLAIYKWFMRQDSNDLKEVIIFDHTMMKQTTYYWHSSFQKERLD